MNNYKPVSADRARVRYFQALNEVKAAANEIERDRVRKIHRKATPVLQHSQRMDRTRKVSVERVKKGGA
jgi:hypothetical protein